MFYECFYLFVLYLILFFFLLFTHAASAVKKKWRLLRSSLIRYIKVFKDKSTSKGNRYRPYYLLECMNFLLPYIDEKAIIRKVKTVQVQQKPSQTTATVTIVKKDTSNDETILYTNSSPNTITYNVVASSSKDSTQEMKAEAQHQTQDIQQYYNAGVKIIGEDYITTYQPGEQLIYQATSTPTVEEQQIQHQECIQEQHEPQQECIQDSKQQMETTIIPIPNLSNVFSSNNPGEVRHIILFFQAKI
jgi:hypothetical protein